jgi:hypothetical protein
VSRERGGRRENNGNGNDMVQIVVHDYFPPSDDQSLDRSCRSASKCILYPVLLTVKWVVTIILAHLNVPDHSQEADLAVFPSSGECDK